MVDRQREKEIS